VWSSGQSSWLQIQRSRVRFPMRSFNFGNTMALGSTQPPTEMSTRNLPGDKGRPARKADNLTAFCKSIDYKIWESRRLITLWAYFLVIHLFIIIIYIREHSNKR
jgi:hypothetical protein